MVLSQLRKMETLSVGHYLELEEQIHVKNTGKCWKKNHVEIIVMHVT